MPIVTAKRNLTVNLVYNNRVMSIFRYLSEFFLFRWLFGKFRKFTTEHGAHTEGIGTPIDRNSEYLNDNHGKDIAPINGAVTPVGDNLLDVSDNSEDLDDLDIFMRNITVIIIPICIMETMAVIIIATAVTAVFKIGIPVVIHNRMMISMTSKTTTI